MRTPLVSVLVPVYNVENYLERCLNSIMNQTLSRIEIICVNDGSTDSSLSILEKYRTKDSRIVIINKQNGGLPSARNAALDVARGKYVGFVDSDDYIEPMMFQKLYETAENEKSDIVICGAHIFPETPRADSWLYQCLSPVYRHYAQFEPEILFETPYTTPFLWRVFVKRSLIEQNHLRLDEAICLGEDKAFQAQIYPKAESITVIPDKLYHYCWFREDSMMQQNVYHAPVKKMKAHIKLVLHIGRLRKKEAAEMRLQFLEWSIPFIYQDFIYLPLPEKVEQAPSLLHCWRECGYYGFSKKIAGWITEQFEYFNELHGEKNRSKTVVSVVMPVSDNAEYIENALSSIFSQTLDNLEVILVNNGVSDDAYMILHRNLFKDKRVRLYNMSKQSYADALNKGIDLAAGEYILFCDSDGWLAGKDILLKWYDYASSQKADMCGSNSAVLESREFCLMDEKLLESRKVLNREYYDTDFHNFLYRTEFLKKGNLKFKECSIMTRIAFVAECLLNVSEKTFFSQYTYFQRMVYRRDCTSTPKVVSVLSVLVDIMKLSLEKKDSDAHAKVLSIINSDYYKHIIVNSTKASCMPMQQCQNRENSQIVTIRCLYQIMQLASPELLEESGYSVDMPYTSVLCEVVKERHKFLADLSNKYISM